MDIRNKTIYDDYNKRIYMNNLCVLCNENCIDTREHYLSCAFSKEDNEKMMEKIYKLFKTKGAYKTPILWFGEKKEFDINALTGNELRMYCYKKRIWKQILYPD